VLYYYNTSGLTTIRIRGIIHHTLKKGRNMLAIDNTTGRVVRVIILDDGQVSIRLPDGTRKIIAPFCLSPL
jgi:hypothetical protein